MVADAAAHARCRARKIRNLILVEALCSLAFFVRANWAWRVYTFDRSVFACSKAVAATGLYWALIVNSDIALSTNSGFSWFT
jgi:hypothetical protein